MQCTVYSIFTYKKFHNKPGIEYETSTNDIELKIEDEKTTDSTPKTNNGISSMLCGVLCKSRLDDVLIEPGKQSNDDSKISTSQGILILAHVYYFMRFFFFIAVKSFCASHIFEMRIL